MAWIKLLALGLMVTSMYGVLFIYEDDVIEICKKGGWAFLFPVSVAFAFSFFHGAFTGLFWDVLGVKPKSTGGK